MSTVKPLFEPFETSIEDIFNQDVIPKWSIPETHVEDNSAYLVNSYRKFDWNIDLKTVDEYTFSFWVTLDVSPQPTNVFLHAGNDLLIALHNNGNFSITQNADGLTRNADDSCSSTNCRKITVFYSIPWDTTIDRKQFHLSLTNSRGTIKLYLNGEYMDSSYEDPPQSRFKTTRKSNSTENTFTGSPIGVKMVENYALKINYYYRNKNLKKRLK